MVPPLPVIYFLILLVLFAAALIIHLHATMLSLPIQKLTIPTILFPLLSGLNTYLYSYFSTLLASAHTVSPSARRRRRRRLVNFVRVSTQSFQLVMGTALATLLLQRMIPNEFLECSLEQAWMRMWKAHDETGIRDVEENLHCCGFNGPTDRAWPFPAGSKPNYNACVEQLGYKAPCHGPWRGYMQKTAGGAFSIVVVVMLMKLANILAHAGYFNRRFTPWFPYSRPLLLPGTDDPTRRPLLEDSRGANGTSGRIIEEGEESGSAQPQAQTEAQAQARMQRGENGGNGIGSIHPSGLGGVPEHSHEANVWSDVPRGGHGRRGSGRGRVRAGSKSSSSSDSD